MHGPFATALGAAGCAGDGRAPRPSLRADFAGLAPSRAASAAYPQAAKLIERIVKRYQNLKIYHSYLIDFSERS